MSTYERRVIGVLGRFDTHFKQHELRRQAHGLALSELDKRFEDCGLHKPIKNGVGFFNEELKNRKIGCNATEETPNPYLLTSIPVSWASTIEGQPVGVSGVIIPGSPSVGPSFATFIVGEMDPKLIEAPQPRLHSATLLIPNDPKQCADEELLQMLTSLLRKRAWIMDPIKLREIDLKIQAFFTKIDEFPLNLGQFDHQRVGLELSLEDPLREDGSLNPNVLANRKIARDMVEDSFVAFLDARLDQIRLKATGI